ncbi:GTPase Era [Serratia symbiotica]|nr:GTPase Era [Serratia symbiotica]
MSQEKQHCGIIAIVGRPNVGKSTLLNQLVGQKVSITSCKPQTTRHCIIGIETEGVYQAIYVDTPGLHINGNSTISRLMNRVACSLITDVEVVIFVVEGTNWTADDGMILNKLRRLKFPVLLVINKVDCLTDKSKLLPHIRFLSQQMHFFDLVPISAKQGMNIDTIATIVHRLLPQSEHLFPDDYITACSHRFLASEIIREKLMRFLGQELPYLVTVEIEQFVLNKQGCHNIHALILVERDSQKKIVIGTKGSKIKSIGIEARQDMEKMFDTIVNLELWVKVKSSWVDGKHALRSLGYVDYL